MVVDIVIICPVEVEFRQIRQILDNPVSVSMKRAGLSFDFGVMKGADLIWNVAIIEPGFNTGSFEMKTHEVIQALKPKYVFLAGIAGGIKDAALGDIVIGTKAYDYESGKEAKERFGARPKVVLNECQELLTIAKRLARETEATFNVYFGAIASGGKVIANTEAKVYQLIKERYNDTLAIEMEAYGFALTASKSKAAYLNVRGVSDLIDNKAKSDAEGHQEKASENVAEFLKKLIGKLPSMQDEVCQTVKVHFTRNRFSSTSWRKTDIGTLQFKEDLVELRTDKKSSLIRNLLNVEHLKMPGDFSKNWVRVKYKYDNTESELYFSRAGLPGLGAFVGGSKDLFDLFREIKNKQITFPVDA